MHEGSQPQANADCAALVAEALAHRCSERAPRVVYLSPGSRSTPLVVALDAHPAIELRVVLDERAAAFAALGAATASGQLVCTVCTSGSAAAHALPAVMEAFHGGAPLLLLTADRPLEAQGIGASQTTSQTQLYAQHTRAAFCLPSPVASSAPARRQVEGQWRLSVARAVQAAQSPLPGPVHVNVPFRDPLGHEPAIRRGDLPPVELGRLAAGAPTGPAVQAAHDVLRAARRVAIAVGPAVPMVLGPAIFADALTSLALRARLPVFVDSSANVPWGESEPAAYEPPRPSPVFVSCGDALSGAPAVTNADAWLHVGLPPSGRQLLRAVYAADARHVIVHPEGMPIDGAHVGDVFLAGSPGPWLEALAARWGAPAPEQIAYEQRLQRAQQIVRTLFESACDDACAPWFEGAALRAIVAASPPSTCFVLGNSLTVRDVDTFAAMDALHARESVVLARRGISGIDGALAHAAGVAAALPARPLALLVGDLTFAYDVQSLRLLTELGRAVQIFVIDNDGGEIFAQLPVAADVERTQRLFRTPQAIDAAGMCRAQGARFVVCHSRAELAAYLQAAAPAPRAPKGQVEVVWLRMPPTATEQRRRVLARASAAVQA